MKVCERYCFAHQLAQDAFQNAFVAIFDKMSQWDQAKGSFEGWCYRIAVNASLAQIRKETKIEFTEVEDAEIEQDLHFELGDGLEYKDLKKIVEELPDGQRMIFNMFAIEGYSHKEIAETLSVSEGTSKSQLAKARLNLKNKYKEYFIEIE